MPADAAVGATTLSWVLSISPLAWSPPIVRIGIVHFVSLLLTVTSVS